MAVKDCETLSNIVAVAIVSGDDELAQKIAEQSMLKNHALQKSRDLKKAGEGKDVTINLESHELELRASSADIKIRAMVQASVLKGGKGNEAFMELARQIVKEKGSLAGGTRLLELVRTASVTDFSEVARLRDENFDVATAMKDLNDGLAEFVSSNYSIRKYSDFIEGEAKKAKEQFKNGKITREQYNEEVKKAHKRAMDRIAKGENPTGFVPMDKEWQAIKKVFGDDPKQAGRVWSSYVMARELLADGGLDDDMLAAFDFGGEALLGDLTIDQINKCDDLDKLLVRAFTNTEQLYRDKALREAYRNKLNQLVSGRKLTKKRTEKLKSLINVSLFAEEGATLSDVLLDNRAFMSMKEMGYKVTEKDGRKIYNDLKSFSKKLSKGDDPKLLDGKVKIAGQEMELRDVLQLIYDVTGDKNILVLVNGGNFSDSAILNVATWTLLGDNAKAKVALRQLFEKGKKGTKITNVRGVFLRAITGMDVPDGAKIAFFDYREGLYYKDELSSYYANYMDKLANKNKMKVPSDGIVNLTKVADDTDENVDALAAQLKEKAGGGFLIVNDSGYKDNPLLRKALNKIKKEDNITILFPKAGMSASFSIENGVVYYKTINNALYNRLAGTISIQSMGEAKPTPEMCRALSEAETGMDGKMVEIKATMEGAEDDFWKEGPEVDGENTYPDIMKPSEKLWSEDGYATLYDVLKNKWYDGDFSVLGKKGKTGNKVVDETKKTYKKTKIDGKKVPTIKVYRVSGDSETKLKYGDTITTSKEHADNVNESIYGGKGNVIEETVPMDKIWVRKDGSIIEGNYFYNRKEINKAVADRGKKVSAEQAAIIYNDELNKAAIMYFGKVLGFNTNVIDSEYIDRVQTALSDMLGIDINAFNTFGDKSELWQRIDKQLSLERMTAGRFDREFVDVNAIRETINSYSDEYIAKRIEGQFEGLIKGGTILGNENFDLIREAWFEYSTAPDVATLLAAKGKIIALANGAKPQALSLNDIKMMFQNKTFAEKYKEMFFPEQEVSDEDMKLFIRQINSDIFDGLSIGFAENLVNAGYSLPLVNVKKLVYDYLNGKLDINSDFAQAFFFKNSIPFTEDNLKTIVETFMPKQYSFDFTPLKGELYKSSPVGKTARVIESKNRFLPDSYSALYAMEDAGKGITLGNKEYAVLKGMIDKYIREVLEGISSGELEFKDAEQLKQELAYAFDAFEQDYILPKYGNLMSPEERQALLGMKYGIPIGVSGQPSSKVEEMLISWRTRILGTDDGANLGWFRNTLGTINDNFDINAAIANGYDESAVSESMKKKIEKRRNQLIENGSTIRNVNGEYVVYSSKEALWDTLQTLPNNIKGLEGLKVLGKTEIDKMTNKEAYVLLRYLEAAKALAATADYATQLMYKQSPQLAQYSFFSTYVIDPVTGLPKIMGGNALAADKLFADIASAATSDQLIKKAVFEEVVAKFRKDGYILAHSRIGKNGEVLEKGLDDMIKDAISRQIDEMQTMKFTPENKEKARKKMQDIYTNMFIPYTYLRDIPSGGPLLDGDAKEKGGPLINVKKRVETTMKEAYEQAKTDLEAAGATDGDKIQQTIYIVTDDGQKFSLKELADQKIDSWKKSIFNDESIIVRSADKDKEFIRAADDTPEKKQEIAAQEREYRERIQNEYLGTFNTILNQGQFITDSERALMTAIMWDVRTQLRKYNLTNKLLEAIDALSGLNEEVARGIKYYLIGFWGTVTFGKANKKKIINRYLLVRDAYKGYYEMSLEQLEKSRPKSKNKTDMVAWNTARYFKNLERLLGSVDGTTGVTTSKAVNKNFYHLGEVFMNLAPSVEKGGIRGIFSMLSAIEQNQVLKFFKFSKPGMKSYYAPFVQNPPSAGGGNFWEGVGGYRDYVQDVNAITQVDFNRLFGSNYDESTFKRVLQGLTGFTISGGGFYRVANKLLDMLNASNMALRMLLSYPGQLITVPLQGAAYFLKQIGQELRLGIEDLYTVDEVREQFGILDGALNELHITGKTNFNPDSKDVNSFYNRYGIPNISDTYKDTGITAADDFINMYAKMDAKFSKFSLNDILNKVAKWFDPYKDNANNFVDGVFARNFKNIAFIKGLKDNTFMKFADARAFAEFMNNPEISNEVKSKLLDAVAASSARNFRNILGLGFGGIDRAVGGSGFGNIMFGLMQMLNFRGSWGQNIFKQTGRVLWNLMQYMGTYVGLTNATREEIARYIFHSPEFTNFMTAFLYDMEWAFKLTRYQDNGRWPDPEEDGFHYFLDYLTFMKENLSMVSQRWQGIQSFGMIRPFLEQGESIMNSQMDPTVYKDTYGLGAFFNALGKNFLRQWKPLTWVTELLGAFYSGGEENARAYINSRFFNLSFGSVKYIVNEDKNAYGYTYEVVGQYGGIPSIGMGEAPIGSDKSFQYAIDNNETWDSLRLAWASDLPWDQRRTYHQNVFKAMINGSQFFSALKDVWNILPTGELTDSRYSKVFFTGDDFSKAIQSTKAGKEFYQKGYVTPQDARESSIFIKTILSHAEYRPGSSKFNKSLMQFDDFGHMDGAKGNEADAEMELWLEHMKYQTDGHGEFILEGGEKVIDPSWTALIKNAKTFYGNQDYVTQLVYNYSKAWLDKHASDPNYPLYTKMLGQGQAYMLLENEIDKRVGILNKVFKKDWKWSEKDFNDAQYRDMLFSMGNSILSGDSITFFERLNRLDEDDATLAAMKIIEDQAKGENLEIISKFFETKTSEYDGEKVESVTLKPAYKSQLEQIGRMAKAMDEGNTERVIAMSSSLVNTYKENDPTGIITANLIDSMYERIYDSPNLTPKQKQEMMIGIFYKNKEFVQHNPEKLREQLGDNYDNFARLMNEMLYKWDGKIISNLESIQTSGDEDAKDAASKAKGISSDFKNAMMKFGSTGGGTTTVGKRAGMGYLQWVPVKIQGADLVKDLGLKGYSPLNVKQTVLKYTPHADFSLKKDVNRSVKAGKTEQVSSKKQLSNIEKKTIKALEAES